MQWRAARHSRALPRTGRHGASGQGTGGAHGVQVRGAAPPAGQRPARACRKAGEEGGERWRCGRLASRSARADGGKSGRG
eukprot:scaffold111843_cov32-Tisochrysis_lutea.AAC.1